MIQKDALNARLGKIELRPFMNPDFSMDVGFHLIYFHENGETFVAEPKDGGLFFEEHPVGGPIPHPLFQMKRHGCQRLMDDLYRMGFRPSDIDGDTAGELKATKAHLQDMRYLTAGHMMVNLPGIAAANWDEGGAE